jgi:hypothetical protein
MKNAAAVTPAKARVQEHRAVFMGPGFRRDDGKEGQLVSPDHFSPQGAQRRSNPPAAAARPNGIASLRSQ